GSCHYHHRDDCDTTAIRWERGSGAAPGGCMATQATRAARVLQGLRDVEAAREEMRYPSFMTGLFAGEPDFDLIAPFPVQPPEDKAIGDAFLAQLEAFLRDRVDPAEIERTGQMP